MERGDRIDGWVVERRLGSGGMGSVFRCHSAATDRIVVAIKVLEVRQNAEASERFVREAAIVAGLDHPNIVRVRNVRTEGDPPYIEMDFVEGHSLEAISRGGPLPYETVRNYLLQTADALTYLHSKGVRHRDLKPANLLVDANDRVKLVDFGLATDASMERITEQGIHFGTVSYAPPEWMDQDLIDPVQWDLYAVGVVFHELLTGTVAFPLSGEGPLKKQLLQVMMRKQNAPPLDPGPEFPQAMRDLIRDLTCNAPSERVRDAATLLARARELPADPNATIPRPIRREELPPAPPGPASLIATIPPVRRRFRWWWALTAAVVFGSAAVVVMSIGVALGFLAWPSSGGEPVVVPEPIDLPVEPEPVAVDVRRRVEVRFTGGPDTSFKATLAGRELQAKNGVVVFDAVGGGADKVRWVAGEGCKGCPGSGCSAWCGQGSVPLQAGSSDVSLTAPSGSGRSTVTVEVPALSAELGKRGKKKPRWPMVARLGSHTMSSTGPATAELTGVVPGRHALVVDVGTCPPEAAGCWPGDTCPERCRSTTTEVIVPWVGGPVAVKVDLELP